MMMLRMIFLRLAGLTAREASVLRLGKCIFGCGHVDAVHIQVQGRVDCLACKATCYE